METLGRRKIRRPQTSPRPLRASETGSSRDARRYTVTCHACAMPMVPRVISYYGHPSKSICPFCGATFMQFPIGVRRLLQRLQTPPASLQALQWLAGLALVFGGIFAATCFGFLPDSVALFGVVGTAIFTVFALAEAFVQVVERTAARFSHESRHYWASIILAAALVSSIKSEFAGYLSLCFIVLGARWLFRVAFTFFTESGEKNTMRPAYTE